MKNAINFKLVLAASLFFAAFFCSNHATAQTVSGRSEHREPTKFQFDILVSNCYAGGTTLMVNIANPELYRFYWEIDGAEGGRGITTATCICGEIATVRVIRNRDGIQVVRSVNLPESCPPGNRL
jgi:hypothetical protein